MSENKKTNIDTKGTEISKDIVDENTFLPEEEYSGAEVYIETKEEAIKESDEPEEDDLEEDADEPEEDEPEEDDLEEDADEPEEDEPEEDENVDYEKIKQDLLNEYAENKNSKSQSDIKEEEIQEEFIEDDMLEEKEIEENLIEKDVQGASSEIDELDEDDYNDKVNLDNNLDIEDIQESLDGNIINNSKSSNQINQEITPDVDQGFSKVAISKGSSIAILIGLVLVFIYIIYKTLQPSEEELAARKSTINKNFPIVTPVEDIGQTIVVPDIPDFPDMPIDLTVPAPKDLPTPPVPSILDMPVLPSPDAISSPSMAVPMALPVGGVKPLEAGGVNIASVDKNAEARAAADAARKKARLTSGMMVGGSGGGGKKNKNAAGKSLSILERNSDQIVATHIGELQRVIAEGKVIDAVLETAINTDLPGLIRAVVSRDVYSEAGTNILINRGSRLTGTYSSDITFGQARVQIVWSRIIRPDGVDIAVDSPGIDAIGRSGSAGEVDNHILRNFTTAMMVSLINIGVAEYADRNGASSSSSSTTTTNTDGSTTSTDDNTALDDAYDDAVDNISTIGTDVIEKTMDMPPTITIDQGTSLKVFVKQDLVFPGQSANLTKLVE